MSDFAPTAPPPARYPVWLGVTSLAWGIVAWTIAAVAPRLAFVPGVEILHRLLPALTAGLVLFNLGAAFRILWRGGRVDELVPVTAVQVGLFTVLFFQVAAHLGAEHYRLAGPARSWEWVGFALAHALRAADILDVIEAYGLRVQTIQHQGPLVATLLVIYHLMINLVVLGVLWAGIRAWKRHVATRLGRTGGVPRGIKLLFLVWLAAWLYSALWWRPWQPVDIPLWLAENLVRVVDFPDVMDSYGVHWHQIPPTWWEGTLTVLGRVCVAAGLGWWARAAIDSTAAGPAGPPRRPVLSLVLAAFAGVAVFVGVAEVARAAAGDACPDLREVACGDDDSRAAAALAALRRMGPNAESTVEPLARARLQVGDERRRAITEVLGYLGPRATETLAEIAGAPDEPEALVAVRGLVRIGPASAPTLLRVGTGSPHPAAREAAHAGLRGFGPEAVPALIPTLTRENSAELGRWFDQLERNWGLRSSPHEVFRAMTEVRHTMARYRKVKDAGDGPRYRQEVISEVSSVERVGQAERAGAYGVPLLLVASLDYSTSSQAAKGAEVRWAAEEALGRLGPTAVPALIAALKDPDKDVRRGAAEALLGRLRSAVSRGAPAIALADPALPALLAALKDEDANVREAAERAFGGYGQAAIPALVAALADKDAGVRKAVAWKLQSYSPGDTREALREIGPPAVEALIAALADENADVRRYAAWALGEIGPPDVVSAVPALIVALKDPDANVRWRAAKALRKIGPDAAPAVPALIAALKDPDWLVRDAAAEALGKIGPAAASTVPALIAALKDPDKDVRKYAAEALGKIGPAAAPAVPALIAALKDQDEDVRKYAAEALGKIGPAAAPAVPALIAAVKDPDKDVRVAAASALWRIGPDAASAVPALIAAVKDQDEDVRRYAAWALSEIGPPAVPALIAALADKDANVRWRAAEALGKIGPAAASAVPALIAALKDPDWLVRDAAAEALGKIGPAAAPAAPALTAALKDPDKDVRKAAAEALGKIGPAAAPAVPALIAALADKDAGVRGSAAEALGKLGPAAAPAVPALIAALADQNADVRSRAAGALGKLGPAAAPAVPALIAALKDDVSYVREAAAEALRKIDPAAKEPIPN